MSLALIVLLAVMQAGSAWAMTMMSAQASGSTMQPDSMMVHEPHGVDAGGTQDAALTDSGCDSPVNNDCVSCVHCIAVAIEFGAIAAVASLPQADRVSPSVSSIKLIHFKPPRFI